jgi:hypothetical protein
MSKQLGDSILIHFDYPKINGLTYWSKRETDWWREGQAKLRWATEN